LGGVEESFGGVSSWIGKGVGGCISHLSVWAEEANPAQEMVAALRWDLSDAAGYTGALWTARDGGSDEDATSFLVLRSFPVSLAFREPGCTDAPTSVAIHSRQI
jgi:hypothetical protein